MGCAKNCLSIDSITGNIVIDEGCVQMETLQLILDTMSAHSFNFIAANVPVGSHKIEVQAKLDYDTDIPANLLPANEDPATAVGQAVATAYVGKGSVTVETVRMVNGITPEI